MHLKTLTMRGFKSFASATTFEFEPGVTAVVGPNGSGKSNVVDALAWVMGEQGAKTLRGGKMEDVIFAGTSSRPALGRAQVALTIDNADGALPIEYSEVTISRTLFRAGGSEYAINGSPCRLLDIQELLSDSGLGREMHVIVGQGQLDRVLHAGPEERRGFIEEAAGILKHRRRKEKTVRKLEAMQANLARLTDLTAELRRQLGPLGKQAAVARRARQVQQDVRDARARLLADDIAGLEAALAKDAADEQALKERRAAVEQELAAGQERQQQLERAAADAAPRLAAAREAWYQLSAVRERLRSLGELARERGRLLGAADGGPAPGRDPEQLRAQAERMRAEAGALQEEVGLRREALEDAVEVRIEAEEDAAAEEQRLAAVLRAAADRREGLARLAGTAGAARSRVESAQAELGRLRSLVAEGQERRARAAEEFAALEAEAAGAEQGEEGLDEEYEQALARREEADAEVRRLRDEERQAERDRETLAARRDALAVGLQRRDGSAALLDAGLDGMLGPLAELVTVAAGRERVVAAALGGAAEALAVAGVDTAVAALEQLKAADAGQAELLLAPRTPAAAAAGTPAPVPDGAEPVAGLLAGPDHVLEPLRQLLAGTVAVPTLADAVRVLAEAPGLRVVTADGDLVSSVHARGGSESAPGLIEVQAAVDETQARLRDAEARRDTAHEALAAAVAARDEAAARADAALAALHYSDARLAGVAERLGSLGSVLRSAEGEAARLQRSIEAAEQNLAAERQALEEAEDRLAAAEQQPADEEEPSRGRLEALNAAAVQARQAEMEARLSLRSCEEQLSAATGRAAALERSAEAERRARAAAAERAERRRRQSARAHAVAQAADAALAFADVSLARAAAERDEAEAVRNARRAELETVRSANAEAAALLAKLTDSVHRDELQRAEQRLRLETLQARSVEELGMTADHLLAHYGPDQPVPVPEDGGGDKWAALRQEVDDDGNPIPPGVPYVRAEQEKRLRKAERDLAALGKVNPLALEEFAALEERHKFLSTQLEDLKATRKDLLDIIKEVDQRVEQVFTEAFHDTAAQFERVFGRLFPGGEGRLVLTEPEDMLTTGIEVEARPAGKKIKRLSLLSGGERSLTAVALLVAIFKARPSPFYVMDEVEAALDDTNLGRLITIFEELRESSQLIVITHQKRTMEVADALYGVTMRGDGVSTVISQRMERTDRREEAAPPQ
ncbi:Chromosome partition protein Smc [Arthrobacter saudimassiliensis]|uniref:Chromosome partition protein Smc n=1 Tax=Arthrobacter saudimassiliensis TaxID=1461584 RepID=A0A078MQ68_9MICC|nr:Chromosome partition protein Smc [Arthrobacter saudimassiliensis]